MVRNFMKMELNMNEITRDIQIYGCKPAPKYIVCNSETLKMMESYNEVLGIPVFGQSYQTLCGIPISICEKLTKGDVDIVS